MNLTDFNTLSLQRRSDIIWEWAYYINKQKNEEINTVLFAAFDFFAEVTMRISDNHITEIRGFSREEFVKKHPYICKEGNPFLSFILNADQSELFYAAA
jgi:hypothetical protein